MATVILANQRKKSYGENLNEWKKANGIDVQSLIINAHKYYGLLLHLWSICAFFMESNFYQSIFVPIDA